jgi:hypothetical protein
LLWPELAEALPEQFTVRTMPDRFADVGDPFAALDRESFDLTPALTWAARDEAEGLGDLPYPPEFPKMPGEPLRVQPSRARASRPQDDTTG